MKRNWFIAISFLLVSLFISSCEIGLGEAVDTQTPTISIEYPEISSIIRDSFILKGSCSDDYGLAKVTVDVYRTDTGSKESIGSYEADISADQKSWSVELNHFDKTKYKYNGWEWADGSYNIEVTTKDKSGKVSQTASRTYDIDNTAPLMILSSPGIDDIKNATGYGTALTIKGNISDLHTANKLVMTVYKSNSAGEKLSVVGTYEETNLEKISDDGIIFARKDGAEDKDARYKQMYDTELGGNQYYICEFTVFDNAKTFKGEAESSNTGNSTSSFYFTDDVYNAWLQVDAELGYSDARKIISSTFTGSYVNKAIETPRLVDGVINRKNPIIHENGKAASDYVMNNLSVNSAVFSLNQDANPKYTVVSYAYSFDKPAEIISAQSNTPISLQFTAGRNGTFVEPKTIKVYQFGPFKTLAEETVKLIYKDPVAYADAHEELTALIGDNSSYESSSVESYPMAAILGEGLTGGQYYIIAATGKDKDGNIADANGFYCVKADTSVIPPRIEWWSSEENGQHGVYVNSVDSAGVTGTTDLTFSGYISSNTELKEFKFTAEVKTSQNAAPESVLSGSLEDGIIKLIPTDVEDQYIWTFSLKDCENFINPPAGSNYIGTVTIIATNVTEAETEMERSFTIDKTDPVVRISSVSPVVKKEIAGTEEFFLNGKIRVSGNIQESNLKQVYYEIKVDDTVIFTSKNLGSSYFTIDATIDTTNSALNIPEDSRLNVIFYAEDKAGNKASHSTKEFHGGKDYIVEQKTDNPVFSISNSAFATTKELIESFFDNSGNNKLNVTVTDDDGLSSVTVTVTKEDGSPLATPIKDKPLSFTANTTSASIPYPLPAEDGIYQVTFTAIDNTFAEGSTDAIKAYRKTVYGPFFVGVDTAAPKVNITSHGTGNNMMGTSIMTGENSGFTLRAKATDNNQIKEVTFTAVDSKDVTKTWTSTNAEHGITYDSAEKIWSKKFTLTDLPDENYTITVTAKDIAGKTASAERSFTVDTIVPVIQSAVLNETKTPVVIGDKNWYSNSQVSAKVITKADTSGINEVSYSFTGDEGSWNSFTKAGSVNADGTLNWTVSIPCSNQGLNEIFIRAIDAAGNVGFITGNKLSVYVDTKGPELKLLKVDTDENFTDAYTKLVNAEAESVTFVVDVTDVEAGLDEETASGIEKVVVTKIGRKTFTPEITGAYSAEDGKYHFTLNKSDTAELNQLVSGDVYVQAIDKVGNKSSEINLFKMDSDIDRPVISIKGINPAPVKSGDDRFMNGTVTLSVSVNESNLDDVWYEIKSDGVLVTDGAGESRRELPSDADLDNPEIAVDTTEFTDNKSIDVIIHAKDKAGNEKSEKLSDLSNSGNLFIINQSTDVPVIAFTNTNCPATPESVTSFFNNTGNNKLIGSVTDDDGVKSLTVTVKNKDGSDLAADNGGKTENKALDGFDSTPQSTQFNYTLPKKDGIYKISFTATDKTYEDSSNPLIKEYRAKSTGIFYVGVDTAAPELTIATHGTGTNTILNRNNEAGETLGLTDGKLHFAGTATDGNGITEISIIASKTGADDKIWTWKKSPAQGETNTVIYDGSSAWSKDFTVGDNNELTDGNYNISVTVTDPAGNSKSFERSFVIDTKNPGLTSSVDTGKQFGNTVTVNGVDNTWYNSSQIAITAKTTDETSGVTTVEYSTDDGLTWNSFTKGNLIDGVTSWSAIASCSNQGLNSIKVRAVDASENTNVLANPIQVFIDTKGASDFELISVDGDENFPGKKLVNKKNNVTFVVKPTDDSSDGDGKYTGIAGVKLIRIGTGSDWESSAQISGTAVSGKEGQFTIEIPAAKLKDGAVWVQVTDKAGNTANFSAFSIEVDETAPTVRISPIPGVKTSTEGKLYVNQTVTVTGSGYDSRELNGIDVYYAIANAKPALPASDQGNPAKWTGWTRKEIEENAIYNWSVDIDTSAAGNDGKNLYVCAVAKDSAENIAVYDYAADYKIKNSSNADINVTLEVNQDSDRPVIRLSNLKLEASNGKYWHTSTEMFGTVSDDDGTVRSVKYKIGATGTLSGNIYENGMWTISNLGSDGAKEIYFVVEDEGGNTFTSNAASTTSGSYGPKIKDSNDSEKLGYTESADDILKITKDTMSPTFSTPKAYVSSSETLNASETWTTSINNTDIFNYVGGVNKYLFVKVAAKDDNGIKAIDVALDSETPASSTNNDAKIVQSDFTNHENSYVVVRFDLSKLTTGNNKDLKVKVIDNANKSAEEPYKVNIDNQKPVVNSTQNLSGLIYGSVDNTIQGTVTENAEIKEMYFAVTLKNQIPAASDYIKVAYSVESENNISLNNWQIHFDGKNSTPDEYHTKTLRQFYKEIINAADEEVLNADDDEKELKLWIYAVDGCGNESERFTRDLTILLNGDKPTLNITYPENGKPVGGTIRVTGTAEIKTQMVDKVYVQIDCGFADDATPFAGDWASTLDSRYNSITSTGKTGEYAKGILANGTTGWSLNINEHGDLVKDSKNIAIRAFAISTTGKVSAFNTVRVTIDDNIPLIGNTTSLQLVQYANADGTPCTDGSVSSGTVAARMDYKDDMFIKGIWYLVGSVEDANGIYKVIIETPNTSIDAVEGGSKKTNDVTVDSSIASSTTASNYQLNLRVGDSTVGQFGKLNYTIKVQDNSESHYSTEAGISLNFDNQAPAFEVTGTSSGVSGSSSFKQIYQNNGTYTINGIFDEPGNAAGNQSGFDKVVMYYTRTLNGTTYLIDPMISNASDSAELNGKANREVINTTNFTSAAADAKDGLFWRRATGTVSNNILTVASFKGDSSFTLEPQVRAGGLVKINNVIYRIKSINGANVTIDGTLQDISSAANVYFAAAALVIDNTVTETGTTSTYDALKSTSEGRDHMSNGDGDQMVEGATKSGTTYTWTASIDSSNILDGDVDVHFVAFDKAMNITKDDTVLAGAKVSNNGPRLAGVLFGTDLNGNGTVDPSEMKTAYAGIYANVQQTGTNTTANGKDAAGNAIREITIPDSSRLIVKGAMKVVPRIVGGNLGLGWQYTYQTAAAGNAEKTTTLVDYGTKVTHSADGTIRNGADGTNDSVYAINISTLNLLQLDSNNGIKSGDQTMKFTVVDKTEGGSLSATVNLPVNIVLTDNVEPTAVFRPFFWNSKDSNSLYNNSRLNGHIELEGDLPKAFTTGGNGVMDRDPKVSGIISMDGVAADNVLVKTIVINVDGTDYIVAERGDNGTWTSENLLTLGEKTYDDYDFASKNWYFELVSDEFDDETGTNTVTFRFHWNTAAMITTVAKTNVAVTVTATDRGSISLDGASTGLTYAEGKSSTPGTTQTTGAANKGYYKMDVVPYVTAISTNIGRNLYSSNESVYSRTAKGHYSVFDGETITLAGFNLKDGAAVTISPFDDTDDVLDTLNASYEVTLPAAAKSGKLKVAVNGITSLNNMNGEDSKGTALADTVTYADYYNRQPNGINNYNLTDDLELDIWSFKQAAKPRDGEILYPEMQIGPNGEVGFAFVNGNFYFNMAGPSNYADLSTYASQRSYEGDYAPYYESALAFNKNGNTFGISTNQDSNNNYSAYTAFYFGQRATEDYGVKGWNSKAEGNYQGGAYRRRLQSTTSSLTTGDIQDTSVYRAMSPSIVACGDENYTNVYTVFYDAVRKEVRYKWGVVTNGIADTLEDPVISTYAINFHDGNCYMHFSAKDIFDGYAFDDGKGWALDGNTYDKVYVYDKNGNKVNNNAYTVKGSNKQYWETYRAWYELTPYDAPTMENDTDVLFSTISDAAYIIRDGKESDVYFKNHGLKVGSAFSFVKRSDKFMENKLNTYYVVNVPDENHVQLSRTQNGTALKLWEIEYENPATIGTDQSATSYVNAKKDEGGFTPKYKVTKVGGQLIDATGGYNGGHVKPAESTTVDMSIDASLYSVVANTNCTKTTAATAIGVVPKGTNGSTDDVVCIVYYDGSAKALKYAYTTTPRTDDGVTENMFATKTIESDAGYNIHIKADTDGGIHMVYFTTSGANLKYAYAPSYDADFTVVTIDNYSLTTNDLGLDVAKVDGKWVPYISYLSGNQAAKLAVAKAWDAATNAPTLNGIENNQYTGNWEISVVPITCKVGDVEKDRTPKYDTICVGVSKNWDTGVLGTIATGEDAVDISNDDTDSNQSTRIYGNGSTNPALAYTIVDDDTLQFIQMN